MNRDESIALLKEGAGRWNEWAQELLREREELRERGAWEVHKSRWHDKAAVDFRESPLKSRYDFSGFVFPGAACFRSATFWDASFLGAKFRGEADFGRAEFSGKADFSQAEFSDSVMFDGATLHNSRFWFTKFSGNTEFKGARFHGGSYFRDAMFSGGADFSQAVFRDGSNFQVVKFSGDASFRGAEFSAKADFERAEFSGSAAFGVAPLTPDSMFYPRLMYPGTALSPAKFSGDINFDRAKFSGEADFARVKFSRKALFLGTKFLGNTSFGEAVFSDAMGFTGAVFSGKTEFVVAAFSANANFNETRFSDEAIFTAAKFSKNAHFTKATFSGDADFSLVGFSSGTLFTKTKFAAGAIFVQCVFGGFTTFDGAKFESDSKIAAFNAINAKSFFSLAGASFLAAPDFTQSHFLEAPRLDNVDIAPPAFAGVKNMARWWRDFPSRLYAGKNLFKRDADASFAARWVAFKRPFKGHSNAPAHWRALKRLAAQSLDHSNESVFFKNEIITRRWDTDQPWHAVLWAGYLYQLTSDFGRSVMRPALLWLLSAAIFAWAYLGVADGPSPTAWIADSAAPALRCKTGAGDPRLAALGASTLKASLVFGLGADGDNKLNAYHACLYGEAADMRQRRQPSSEAGPPAIPFIAVLIGIVQSIVSATLAFLLLLAIRNYFRIK